MCVRYIRFPGMPLNSITVQGVLMGDVWIIGICDSDEVWPIYLNLTFDAHTCLTTRLRLRIRPSTSIQCLSGTSTCNQHTLTSRSKSWYFLHT